MRPSPLILTTLLLGVAAAFVIVGPSSRASGAEPLAAAAGGCKSLASFVAKAAPALQKEGCAGCHGGVNLTAKAALDLTGLGNDNAAACAQVLTKVTLANKAQSPVIQAPAGTQSHMGGKVDDPKVFTAAMLAWMNDE